MKKSQKICYILLGMFLMLVLNSLISSAFAETFYKQISVLYDDIKVVVNGVQIDKDGAGSPVTPFMLNGITYLPARVIGEAFVGDKTSWDEETHTLYLGPKPDRIAGEIRLVKTDLPYRLWDKPLPQTAEEVEEYLLSDGQTQYNSLDRLETESAIVQYVTPTGVPHMSADVYIIDRSGNLYHILNDRPFINGWGNSEIRDLQFDGTYIKFTAMALFSDGIECWVDIDAKRLYYDKEKYDAAMLEYSNVIFL